MASPPPIGKWDELCQGVLDHQKTFGEYSHCSRCFAINPRPPAKNKIQRYTSLAPEGETANAKSGTQSAPPPRAQQFGMMPSNAEAQRQLGFKNRQPAESNAGSRALSFRQEPHTSPASPSSIKLLAVKCQIYLSEVVNAQNATTFQPAGKRLSIKAYSESWFNQFRESDWQTRERNIAFIDWIIAQSGTKESIDLELLPGYSSHYLCTQVDVENLSLVRVGAAIERRETLEEKLSCFPSIIPNVIQKGAGDKSKGQQRKDAKEFKEILIVVEIEPKAKKKQKQKAYFQDNFGFHADHGSADHGFPNYELSPTLSEGPIIKKEKPSWYLAEFDANDPPPVVDLTSPQALENVTKSIEDKASPSRNRRTFKIDERIKSPPLRERKGIQKETGTSSTKNIPKKQAKRQKGETQEEESANHSYETRSAGRRGKDGSSSK